MFTKFKRRCLLAVSVMILALSACAAPAPASAPNAALPANLPDGQRWLQHLNEDLLPFWTNEAALGQPIGNFPSTRCNDGSALDRAKPCPEIKGNGWLMQDRNYVVSMSRQTYGYGAAFHLNGDPRYLRWAKIGVDYLRANAFDKSGGGTFAYWDGEARAWGPEPAFRNPQELAYALLGIGFYYYLTRDPDVLPDLLKAKDHIFKRYYNADLNALQWMLESTGDAQATNRNSSPSSTSSTPTWSCSRRCCRSRNGRSGKRTWSSWRRSCATSSTRPRTTCSFWP